MSVSCQLPSKNREMSGNSPQVDLDVGKQDEPPVPRATLQFTRALCATHTASGILSTNADTKEETVRGERCKKTSGTASSTIRSGAQDGEEDDDQGGGHKRPFAREVIGGIAEEKHSYDGASEGNGRDVVLCAAVGVGIGIDLV